MRFYIFEFLNFNKKEKNWKNMIKIRVNFKPFHEEISQKKSIICIYTI
jgi:hypothetical protein